jgi:hypothetical protein
MVDDRSKPNNKLCSGLLETEHGATLSVAMLGVKLIEVAGCCQCTGWSSGPLREEVEGTPTIGFICTERITVLHESLVRINKHS